MSTSESIPGQYKLDWSWTRIRLGVWIDVCGDAAVFLVMNPSVVLFIVDNGFGCVVLARKKLDFEGQWGYSKEQLPRRELEYMVRRFLKDAWPSNSQPRRPNFIKYGCTKTQQHAHPVPRLYLLAYIDESKDGMSVPG